MNDGADLKALYAEIDSIERSNEVISEIANKAVAEIKILKKELAEKYGIIRDLTQALDDVKNYYDQCQRYDIYHNEF
jgi:hypothetical protein